MFSANRKDRAIRLFVNATILPLNFFLLLWIRLKLNARHRRKKCTDNYFELVFKDIKFTSLFYTLITSQNVYRKKSRLDIQKDAFSRVGAKIWNEMPNSLKNISRKTFIRALLNILKTEDNYIDNDKIMARLKNINLQLFSLPVIIIVSFFVVV